MQIVTMTSKKAPRFERNEDWQREKHLRLASLVGASWSGDTVSTGQTFQAAVVAPLKESPNVGLTRSLKYVIIWTTVCFSYEVSIWATVYHRICNWKHTGNMDQPDRRSNFLSPVKKDCDDWRQILVEASCERSVGESLQQVSSCNDCLKIVFAQLKCWSRYIYIYTCYIYILYYIHVISWFYVVYTYCMHIYI